MKRYEYEEWDFLPGCGVGDFGYSSFDERIYVDLEGKRITGILEGFYCYTGTTSTRDPKNCQYVENGKKKKI